MMTKLIQKVKFPSLFYNISLYYEKKKERRKKAEERDEEEINCRKN